jgi:hypothetical protein
LTIGSNGEIYAQGNEVMGLDKVIMLKPKQALGGISNEWECFTNLKTATVSQCKFDKNLVFPGINSSTDN